jgi:hypothetical protein
VPSGTAGIRARASLTEHGEADISECSLFCEDYRRLGATRVAVDPSVRVSYLPWARDFYGALPGGIGAKVPWPHVLRSGALEQLQTLWGETHGCMSMQWVPLSKSRASRAARQGLAPAHPHEAWQDCIQGHSPRLSARRFVPLTRTTRPSAPQAASGRDAACSMRLRPA